MGKDNKQLKENILTTVKQLIVQEDVLEVLKDLETMQMGFMESSWADDANNRVRIHSTFNHLKEFLTSLNKITRIQF